MKFLKVLSNIRATTNETEVKAENKKTFVLTFVKNNLPVDSVTLVVLALTRTFRQVTNENCVKRFSQIHPLVNDHLVSRFKYSFD